MEIFINNFWKEFEANQYLYLNQMRESQNNFLSNPVLTYIVKAIHKDMDVVILDTMNPKIVFIIKGKLQLQKQALQIIKNKPPRIIFKTQIGIPPFKGTIQEFDYYYNPLGTDVNIFQIYFSIRKIYKTTKKMHLYIYLQCTGKFEKYILNPVARTCLILYLGDETYFSTIAQIKIVRRKYNHLNLIPIELLKQSLQL